MTRVSPYASEMFSGVGRWKETLDALIGANNAQYLTTVVAILLESMAKSLIFNLLIPFSQHAGSLVCTSH
jgi:hypothetical protein